jgi:hypothetical protein
MPYQSFTGARFMGGIISLIFAEFRGGERSAALMIQNPWRFSFAAVYGPRVTGKSLPDWRTTVADSPCARPGIADTAYPLAALLSATAARVLAPY